MFDQKKILTAEASFVRLSDFRRSRGNIKSFQTDRALVTKASGELKSLGFNIEAEGVVSLTISGKKEIFENVFKIRLEEKKQPISDTFIGAQASYYVPVGTLRIPENLKGLIQEVVFPVPPIPF